MGVALICKAQNFEWVKSYGGTGGENYPVCFHSKDNSYLGWTGFVQTQFGSSSKKSHSKYLTILGVGKIDKSGSPQWMWSSDSIIGSASISSILFDSLKENTFVSGRLSGKLYSNNKVYSSFYSNAVKKYSENGFIIKLDKSGTIEKVLIINDSNQTNINSINFLGNSLVFTLSINIWNKANFCGIGMPCISKSGIILCQLDSNLNLIAKSSLIECGNVLNESIEVNKSKLVLVTLSDKMLISDSINYYNNSDGFYAVSYNTNLRVKSAEKLYSGKYSQCNASLTENDDIIVSTAFSDSIIFKNRTVKTDKYLRPVILIYDKDYNLKFASFPKITGLSSINYAGSQYYTSQYYEGYIYAGGNIQGDYKFGDISTFHQEGGVFITKLDLRGNFLWAKRFANLNGYINDISPYNKEILLSGVFSDTAYLNLQQFISNGSLDILAAKIHDIEITRGYVKSGPYCAGDTVKIPYTKNGTFNKGNQFIAQLSDADGNFTGKERELGRLTSDKDSIIRGLLPLFDVESSPNYRIRILSTNPVVQTYYKYDTLRLLIYSKDTANAGKDTTICHGQTVKLTTTGGSRWRWSPANLVQDSTAKTTLAIPIVTTKYRIIISDSSGCGKIDTAYKTITVRPPLKIKGLPKDTTVCKDRRAFLRLIPSGGLTVGYSYQWLSNTNQPLAIADTFSINVSMPLSTKAVLSDGCSLQNDTVVINFKFPISNFSQLLKDTIVCKNSEPILKLIPSNGLQKDYSYQWFSDFIPLANTDTMWYKITQPETLKAILTYNCSGKQDTSFIKLILPAAITSKIDKPNCFDSSVTLKITGTGGYKNSLNHVWYKDNKAIDIGKTISLTGIHKKQWIQAITTDHCQTTVKDSVQLFPNPKAKLVLSLDSVCQFQPVTIHNQSQSFSPINSTLILLSNQNPLKNKDTTLLFAETGKQTIQLQIADSMGCTANASASLMVIEKPNADFAIIPENPTVDNGTVELTPMETTYKKYNWAIGEDLRLFHKSWQSVRLPVIDTATYEATLMVSNTFGCTDTVTKIVRIGVSDAFYIPNAVSRNDDGLNDEFAPYGWKIQSYQMLIVARTDQVVYKGSNPWKPTYEDGVYSYVIKVKFKDGSENTFKGHVHVIH